MSSGILVTHPKMVAVGVILPSLTQEEQMLAPSEPAMGIYELMTMEPEKLVFVAMEYASRLSSEKLTPTAAAQEMSSLEIMLAIAPEMLLLA